MLVPKIYGKKVVNAFFANYGYFGEGDMRYIYGYVTVYSNGFKTVINGGGASGSDIMTLTLLDKKNKIVEKYSETL